MTSAARPACLLNPFLTSTALGASPRFVGGPWGSDWGDRSKGNHMGEGPEAPVGCRLWPDAPLAAPTRVLDRPEASVQGWVLRGPFYPIMQYGGRCAAVKSQAPPYRPSSDLTVPWSSGLQHRSPWRHCDYCLSRYPTADLAVPDPPRTMTVLPPLPSSLTSQPPAPRPMGTGELTVMQLQLQALPPLPSLPQALHHYDITASRRHHHCPLLALLGWFQLLWTLGSSEGGAWGVELSEGGASPSSPWGVAKRPRGAVPSVKRVDCSPRPCSSFTWGWAQRWPRLLAGHASPQQTPPQHSLHPPATPHHEKLHPMEAPPPEDSMPAKPLPLQGDPTPSQGSASAPFNRLHPLQVATPPSGPTPSS